MVCSDNNKICFIVIFNYYASTEPIAGELLPPLLPSRWLGKELVMSQAEIPNPYLSLILHFISIKLAQFSLKPLVSNK